MDRLGLKALAFWTSSKCDECVYGQSYKVKFEVPTMVPLSRGAGLRRSRTCTPDRRSPWALSGWSWSWRRHWSRKPDRSGGSSKHWTSRRTGTGSSPTILFSNFSLSMIFPENSSEFQLLSMISFFLKKITFAVSSFRFWSLRRQVESTWKEKKEIVNMIEYFGEHIITNNRRETRLV